MTPEFKASWFDKALGRVSPSAAIKRLAAKQVLHQFAYDGARATHKRMQAPQNMNPNDFSKQRDRLQLMREAEDLENNFAPAKMLNRKYAMYVAPVGYHAATGNPALDSKIDAYLTEKWFPHADVTGRYDFFKMMEFGVMGMNRAGDYGWAYVRPGSEGMTDPNEIVKCPLKLQAVEADRLGGIWNNVVSNDYVGGIILGRYGEPVAYRVYRRGLAVQDYNDPVDVPAGQFVHYTDPMRIDTYRGVTKLETAVTNLRDLYEMVDFLKGKAKLASALTVFTNSNGVVQGPHRLREFLRGLGRSVAGTDEERHRVPEPHLGALNVEPPGRLTGLVTFDNPRMVRTHPENAGIEALDECCTLKSEDQREGVRMHVPHRAVGAEPSGITLGPGKV
jgi:capsid protein